MFKSGDKALLPTGEIADVVEADPSTTVVVTTLGSFEERDLKQGHPSVLGERIRKRVDIKGILSDSDLREDLMVSTIKSVQAVGGVDTTENQARTAYENTLASYLEVKNTLFPLLEKLDIDYNGHWRDGKSIQYFLSMVLSELYLSPFSLLPSKEQVDELLVALRTKKSLGRWIPLIECRMPLLGGGCSYCGADHFFLETDGLSLRLSGEKCPLPNGFDPNEWELNVPSGKIVVANDLRDWFPLPYGSEDLPSVNSVIGCRAVAQAYAQVGLAHAFVGNTCPSVIRLSDASFKISSEPSEDVWNGEEWVEREDPVGREDEVVASICTDLWWYSLCDLDELERRFARFGKEHDRDFTVIDVKPGVYKFRHNDSVDESEEEEVFSTFEWVRDPDPVRDFVGEYADLVISPHAFVQAKVKRWPTLYGGGYKDKARKIAEDWCEMTSEQQNRSWASVADHVFFTIGSGQEWHDKGFPVAQVDSSIPDIEPPEFRFQYSWYPFSKPYGGIYEQNNFESSWAKLAFRALESVISFGMPVDSIRDKKQVKKLMNLAAELYLELAATHSSEADPNYVRWLSQPERVKEWVSRFDIRKSTHS